MGKNSFLTDLLDLCYPSACTACQTPLVQNEDVICTYCLHNLPLTGFELLNENPLLSSFTGRCRLEKAASYMFFEKGGRVQNLLHALKYLGRKEVGQRLGELMGRSLQKSGFLNTIDLIIPIPLHPRKFKKRGYNQSSLLAQPIARINDIPFLEDALIRGSFSETQTRKSRFARWLNVRDIFQVADREVFKDRHVLIIDDVVTTGSTVEACADKLAAIPGCRQSLFTAAIAL